MNDELFDLTGRTAVVTGASRGLGLYFSRALAKAGADLVITSRELSRLTEIRSELTGYGVDVLPLELDVRDPQSIRMMVDRAAGHFQNLDILVNNAGCNIRKPSIEISWEDWNTVLETNLRGPFFVAQAVATYMIREGYGRIINIGSVTSVFGYAGIAPYCASRGGIKQLTMSLADEWGGHGITVNCLAPGWFQTEQTRQLYENADWVDYIEDRIPLNRAGMPKDLDGALIFMASESSRYMTGQCLLIDGGISTGATKASL